MIFPVIKKIPKVVIGAPDGQTKPSPKGQNDARNPSAFNLNS